MNFSLPPFSNQNDKVHGHAWRIRRTRVVVIITVALSIDRGTLLYSAPKGNIAFKTTAFTEEAEITSHPVLRLSVSLRKVNSSSPSELDIFVTLHCYYVEDQESKSRPRYLGYDSIILKPP